jgi:hypothetical protein
MLYPANNRETKTNKRENPQDNNNEKSRRNYSKVRKKRRKEEFGKESEVTLLSFW